MQFAKSNLKMINVSNFKDFISTINKILIRLLGYNTSLILQ